MSHKGKTQITIVFTASLDLVAEGDRILASYAKWMRKTHSREGETALLHYNVVKGPDRQHRLRPDGGARDPGRRGGSLEAGSGLGRLLCCRGVSEQGQSHCGARVTGRAFALAAR